MKLYTAPEAALLSVTKEDILAFSINEDNPLTFGAGDKSADHVVDVSNLELY